MADVFTNAGKGAVTSLLVASTYKYVGWGTGTTNAAAGDTAIETESTEARVSPGGNQTQQTTTSANDTYQVTGTITANATKTIANAGVLSAVTGGTLLVHSNFTGIPLLSGDSIAFTFKLQFT